MITVIPDIHADLERLEATLAATDGPLAFLGDFIDGGGQGACDRTVLTRVRGLIDDGAVAVMGNHELNAILFHRKFAPPLSEDHFSVDSTLIKA